MELPREVVIKLIGILLYLCMAKIIDMTNQVFGQLIVLRFDKVQNKNSKWFCKCNVCGNVKSISRPDLLSGKRNDCGCRKSEKCSASKLKHGMIKTKTYSSWSKMKYRIKVGAKHSPVYGTITMDERWNNFENFLQDMGERPEGKTLDRIDNTKGYYKENCRWATHKEQCNNRSTNVMLTYDGKTMNQKQWAEHLGINRDTIRRRIKRGLPINQVLCH